MWRQAQTLSRKEKTFPDWRKMVSSAHGDIELPNDLVKRLQAGPYLDRLPAWLKMKVEGQGTDARPSHLALEQAARLCGALPYQFTLYQLNNYRRAAAKSGDGKEIEIEGTH